MKIRITDLPLQGLKISDVLALEPLHTRINQDQTSDFIFRQPPSVTITAKPIGSDGAEITGQIDSTYAQGCSLCLEPAEQKSTIPINFQLRIRPQESTSETDFEDDIGIYFFNDETVDLTDLLQETLILSLSIFWHPEFKGATAETEKCSSCSKTRKQLGLSTEEKATTLGDLLKKASRN